MLKIRNTINRLRGRPPGHESQSTKRRFPKLHMKFDILKKFKSHKHKSTSSKNKRGVNNTQLQTEDEEGFEGIKIQVHPPDEDIETADDDVDNGNYVYDGHNKPVNELNHEVLVTADFHESDALSSTGGLLNSHSEVSLLKEPSSRNSVISQRSLSNSSLVNYKRFGDSRTVWTQTEPETQLADKSFASLDTDCSDYYTPGDTDLDDVRVDPASCCSLDFGVDSALKEPVENAKLAAIRDRIVSRLTFPDLNLCQPEVCVQLLGYAKLPFLWKLNQRLADEDGEFNEEFIAYRGLDYLLVLMEDTATYGLKTFTDVFRMLILSECATTLVNSPSGRDFIINNGEHVVSLAKGT